MSKFILYYKYLDRENSAPFRHRWKPFHIVLRVNTLTYPIINHCIIILDVVKWLLSSIPLLKSLISYRLSEDIFMKKTSILSQNFFLNKYTFSHCSKLQKCSIHIMFYYCCLLLICFKLIWKYFSSNFSLLFHTFRTDQPVERYQKYDSGTVLNECGEISTFEFNVFSIL